MKPFRDRNPVAIGAVSVAVIVGLLFVALNAAGLPVVGSGPEYRAVFANAAGLKVEDQVQVSGVKVGKVESVGLTEARDAVEVVFRADSPVPLGDQTRAVIRVRTLLGQKYLALEPDGDEELDGEDPIPLSRTTVPFDVVQSFEGLGETASEINKERLAEAFTTLSDTFRGTPPDVQAAFDGLSRLSEVIVDRDDQLARLLAASREVTQVLADQRTQFTQLLEDGNRLFQAVNAREEIIERLLVDVRALSIQIQGLVAEVGPELQPALARLDAATDIFVKNQNNLATYVEFVGPFVRLFSNTIGTGRWFDTFIQNIGAFPVDAVLAQIPAALGGQLPVGGDGGGNGGLILPGDGEPLDLGGGLLGQSVPSPSASTPPADGLGGLLQAPSPVVPQSRPTPAPAAPSPTSPPQQAGPGTPAAPPVLPEPQELDAPLGASTTGGGR